MPGTFVVVAITREEARVWKTGVKPGTQPEKIYAPSEDIHKHMRVGQHHKGHDTDHDSQKFYESIAKAVSDAGEILIIGHGKGKASASLKLIQAWERRHAYLDKKVVTLSQYFSFLIFVILSYYQSVYCFHQRHQYMICECYFHCTL